ncbi:MAG TPA: sugar transferase [Bacillota bacterium]|nr:sugar transferase [Bacillota bacterium]HPO96327.1 sugar transferase [Bacillota bacterium]
MVNRKPKTIINLLQMLGDFVLVNLAIVLLVKYIFNGNEPWQDLQAKLIFILLTTVIAKITFEFFGLYDNEEKTWTEQIASLIVSLVFLNLLMVVVLYIMGIHDLSLKLLLLIPVVQFATLFIWHWFIFEIERRMTLPSRTIIIAPSTEIGEIIEKVDNGFDQILGVVSDTQTQINNDKYRWLGTYQDMMEVCSTYKPDKIIISGNTPEEYKKIAVQKSIKFEVEVLVIPGLYEIMLSQNPIGQIKDTLVFRVGTADNVGKEHIKRIIDLGLGLVGLIIFFPVMLIVALLIKLESPGPIIYSQERISLHGKRFMLLKFRTMVQGAEDKTGPVLATEQDPRITKVGRFLRATRLDELPQIFNIIKGDMSFVGPRPERPFFVEQFEKTVPDYYFRHFIKPGLTGLAQIAGRYSTSVEDKIRYDLLYLQKFSLLLDLQIILLTIKVILMKDKAS